MWPSLWLVTAREIVTDSLRKHGVSDETAGEAVSSVSRRWLGQRGNDDYEDRQEFIRQFHAECRDASRRAVVVPLTFLEETIPPGRTFGVSFQERSAKLTRCLDSLDAEHARTLAAFWPMESDEEHRRFTSERRFSDEEAAARLGIPVAEARRRYQYALIALRELLLCDE